MGARRSRRHTFSWEGQLIVEHADVGGFVTRIQLHHHQKKRRVRHARQAVPRNAVRWRPAGHAIGKLPVLAEAAGACEAFLKAQN
jgi:hypothetical protein